MRASAVILLVWLTVAAPGCGGGGTAPIADFEADVDIERLTFARAMYGVEPSTPAGFHADPDPYPDRLTLRYHVLASEVAGSGGGEFEICTDSLAAALAYSDASAAQRGYSTALTATTETDWYFQFDRSVVSGEPSMLINRVFRCDALDRSSASTSSAGRINREPITADHLRFVAEYLWTLESAGQALVAVTDSSAAGNDAHRLRVVEGFRFAARDGCDLVEIWDRQLRVDAASGQLTSSLSFVDAFESRYEAGIVSLCGD